MAGEVLGYGSHSGTTQASRKSRRQLADHMSFLVECAIANDLADTPVQIDTRCETQIDAGGAKFRGYEPARLTRQACCRVRIVVEFEPEVAHRRNRAETISKALHAPSLMVDGDE